MGFYSFKCKACQESIKAPYELPRSMAWQNAVVVVIDENTLHTGAYDGYGRVNKTDSTFERITEDTQTDWTEYGTQHGVWHQRCFLKAAQILMCDLTAPTRGFNLIDYGDLASLSAPDQGYFYDRPEGDELLNRPFQRPDKNGVVDTRLMHENDAAATFE